MKILTVLGARPQFIKAGSVSREIGRQIERGVPIREVILHTGQHYDSNMSDVFFREMQIPKPDYRFDVGGLSHGAMTGKMIEKVEAVLLGEKPDLVMVYGDTNSTLAGALAAVKLNIPVAHVEAGLRSFNMHMPEEVNRVLTDRVSRYLFCPTQQAVENLRQEGSDVWHSGARVVLSGDVMYDGVLHYRPIAKQPENLDPGDNFVLCTLHRQENTDDPAHLGGIIAALVEIACDRQVIFPLHPRTRKKLDQEGIDTSGINFLDPLGYLNMIWLLDHCSLVMTDSGGLQKEAYFFGKPCITLRNETEWVELVAGGFNRLAGVDPVSILEIYRQDDFSDDFDVPLYGDGQASRHIVAELMRDG